MEINEAKGKTWKFGKKHDIRGTVAAALKHHPEKFSTDDHKKMNPYAIFTAKKKEKGGMESHYKDQSTTSDKSPKKKARFKDEDKKDKKDKKDESLSLWRQWMFIRETRENGSTD